MIRWDKVTIEGVQPFEGKFKLILNCEDDQDRALAQAIADRIASKPNPNTLGSDLI